MADDDPRPPSTGAADARTSGRGGWMDEEVDGPGQGGRGGEWTDGRGARDKQNMLRVSGRRQRSSDDWSMTADGLCGRVFPSLCGALPPFDGVRSLSRTGGENARGYMVRTDDTSWGSRFRARSQVHSAAKARGRQGPLRGFRRHACRAGPAEPGTRPREKKEGEAAQPGAGQSGRAVGLRPEAFEAWRIDSGGDGGQGRRGWRKKGCRGLWNRDRVVSTVSRPSACFAQALAGG